MAINSPPIVRMAWTTCKCCGKESSMCAKVSVRVGGWLSKRYDRAVMTCAQCREHNRGNWIIDRRWQPPEPQLEPRSGGAAWEEWKRQNPPIEERFEDDE